MGPVNATRKGGANEGLVGEQEVREGEGKKRNKCKSCKCAFSSNEEAND
jgi:hypothetical protein